MSLSMENEKPYKYGVSFGRNAREVIFKFHRLMGEEHEGKNKFLDQEDTTIFRKYYSSTFRNRARILFYSYTYFQRLQYIVSLILENPQKRILDAGCGLGSESILFGLLGAEVIGIDLKKPRLKVAKNRIHRYNKIAGFGMKVQFFNTDVFNILESNSFDIVWANESISHIDPAEKFIKLSYECLNKGGRLIVSDSNFLNLCVAGKKFLQNRSLKTFVSQRKDPLTGKVVSYAHERLFTVYQMKKMLRDAGFRIEKTEVTHFIPNFLVHNIAYFPLVKGIERLIENSSLNCFGIDYRIIGIKSV